MADSNLAPRDTSCAGPSNFGLELPFRTAGGGTSYSCAKRYSGIAAPRTGYVCRTWTAGVGYIWPDCSQPVCSTSGSTYATTGTNAGFCCFTDGSSIGK